MKICVYAIAKNEEQFVDRWAASMSEADDICVLDTGSTDRTVEQLADLGVRVRQEEIRPWRFDVARNRSMELIPEDTDVCVCTDLDEILRPGWREKLERAWEPGTEQLRYTYIWSFGPDGRPGTEFLYEKIHAPGVFEWHHPVHEVLRRTDGARTWKTAVCPEIVLEHHPDPTKSRGSYLPLLRMSVREDPEDDRNAHYLGRELMFHGLYAEAIAALKHHLEMPRAVWRPERCASMRFISRCYLASGDRVAPLAGCGRCGPSRRRRSCGSPGSRHRRRPTPPATGRAWCTTACGPRPSKRSPAATSTRTRPGGPIPGTPWHTPITSWASWRRPTGPARSPCPWRREIPGCRGTCSSIRKEAGTVTAREAIAAADAEKPNAFDEKTKFEWLRRLEGHLMANVFLMAPAQIRELDMDYETDMDRQLLVDPPHDDIYPLYLKAKIDEGNGEYNKYADSMAIYNSAYTEFVCWFCQLYDPAEGYMSEEVMQT